MAIQVATAAEIILLIKNTGAPKIQELVSEVAVAQKVEQVDL